jgi:transposase-like protein
MGIKSQIITEMELRKKLRGEEKMTIKDVAKSSGVSYNNLLKWVNQPERSLGDANLEKVVSALNKKIILVDKNA